MGSRLRVNTKAKSEKILEQNEAQDTEPLSPMSECLAAKGSIPIIAVFESETPIIDNRSVYLGLTENFLPIHPRFSTILVDDDMNGGKMWKRVNVNVEDHVKVPNFSEVLSTREYRHHFDDYLNKIANEELGFDKPLWELHIFKYPLDNAAGVIIFKVAHLIADGVSLMGAIFSCCQRTDNPLLPLTFPSATRINSIEKQNATKLMLKICHMVPHFLSSIFYSLCDLGNNIKMLLSQDDRSPIRSGNTESQQITLRVCTITLPLDDVKRVKALLGVTVTDVLVGIIFLGIRLYMQEINEGRLKNTRSTTIVPVNMRAINGFSYAPPEEMKKKNTKVPWGNRFSTLEFAIPNLDGQDLDHPLNFVMKAHKTIMRKRNVFALYLMSGLFMAVQKCIGTQAFARIVARKWTSASVAITSMIGPTEQMSMGNHRIKNFYFVPCWRNMPLIVSVMSYMGTLNICLSFEEGFVHQQRLMTCFEKAFQMIFQAAMSK